MTFFRYYCYMCRRSRVLSGRLVASLSAGFVALMILVPSASTAAQGVPGADGLNGPGEPQIGRLALGSLTISSPAECTLAYTLQVLTESGSGADTFELQIFDDGNLVQIQPLSAPADGAVHALSGDLRLQHPVSQTSPGLGVYLVDSSVILDFADPVDIVCGFVEIPTLDSAGMWILTGLLLASALVVFRRSRRTA